MSLELRLRVVEAGGAIDADCVVSGIGDHHERASSELAKAVAADVVDEGAGKAAAAMVGMGLDGLEARKAWAGADKAHLRDELTVEKGAEPGAVPCRREGAVARGTPTHEEQVALGVIRVVAGHLQLGVLRPVGV